MRMCIYHRMKVDHADDVRSERSTLKTFPEFKMNLSCVMLGCLSLVDQKDIRPWTVCNASGCGRFQTRGEVLRSLSVEGKACEKDAAASADWRLRCRDLSVRCGKDN